MKPSWKDGFELRHERALAAESPRCCLLVAPDLPSAESRMAAVQATVEAEPKDKTRRRHFPAASIEPQKGSGESTEAPEEAKAGAPGTPAVLHEAAGCPVP